MEHIVYLIALQKPKDLLYVKKHAQKVSSYMKQINADAVNYAALATANWRGDYGDLLCIGDNRKDSLLFYPIKDFIKNLVGFTYLPIVSEQSSSLYNAFDTFCQHEMRIGANNGNESYKVIVIDFRKNAPVFIGNEADVLARSLEYNFGKRSSLSILYRKENRHAYVRLEELLSDDTKVGIIGAFGKSNPMSKDAIASMFS